MSTIHVLDVMHEWRVHQLFYLGKENSTTVWTCSTFSTTYFFSIQVCVLWLIQQTWIIRLIQQAGLPAAVLKACTCILLVPFVQPFVCWRYQTTWRKQWQEHVGVHRTCILARPIDTLAPRFANLPLCSMLEWREALVDRKGTLQLPVSNHTCLHL